MTGGHTLRTFRTENGPPKVPSVINGTLTLSDGDHLDDGLVALSLSVNGWMELGILTNSQLSRGIHAHSVVQIS